MGASQSKESPSLPSSPPTTTPPSPSSSSRNETSSNAASTPPPSTSPVPPPDQPESKCPMRWGQKVKGDGAPPAGHPIISQFWKSSSSVTPPSDTHQSSSSSSATAAASSATASQCPMKKKNVVEYNVYAQPIDPTNQMPAVANQLPSPGQREELSTERVVSTIPKGGTEGQTWTYPSPQMFYNALSRKNKLGDTPESDIPSIVAIHNNMNESTWSKILEWERVLHPTADHTPPQLLHFRGRPNDLSPKALLKHWVFAHPLPFDRHDWVIYRPGTGEEVRYVIDYYHDEERASDSPESGFPALNDRQAVKSILVDVRPAVDGWEGVWGRAVAMPREAETVGFEYLPVRPGVSLAKQMEESLRVWEEIKRTAAENGACNDKGEGGDQEWGRDLRAWAQDLLVAKRDVKEAASVDRGPVTPSDITEAQAKEIASSFAKILKDCQTQHAAMTSCSTEEDRIKASMGVTACVAKILCPLQHKMAHECLGNDSDNVSEEEYEMKVEAAWERMEACVVGQNERAAVARGAFPDLFKDLQ